MSNQKNLLKYASTNAVFAGIASSFIIPFALLLGASNEQIGIIAALPALALIIAQIPAVEILKFFRQKKKTAIVFFILSSLVWIPIVLMPYLFPTTGNLILLLALYYLFANSSLPAWIALNAEIIPEKIRGKFFSKRNALTSGIGMLAYLAGGIYLDKFPTAIGFSSLFAIGLIASFISFYYVFRIKEKPDHIEKINFKDMFALNPSLKRFIRFEFLFSFAFMLASPFFTVYMLENLNVSYTFYVAMNAISTISGILVYRHIGRLSDRFGDKPVALASTIGTAFVPLMFLFTTPERIWLLIPTHFLVGIVWAGADLGYYNLLLDFTDERKRAAQVAGSRMIIGTALFISPIIGGIISEKASFILAGIPLVFAISFVLRFLSGIFIKYLPEPRSKRKVTPGKFIHAYFNMHPVRDVMIDINHIFHRKQQTHHRK